MRSRLLLLGLIGGFCWGTQAAAEPAYGTPDYKLQRALRGCQPGAVVKALQAGADPNLRLADGTPGVVRCVGTRQVLAALLGHGAEVDAVHPKKQRTGLAELTEQKRLHPQSGVFLLSLLLEYGADPNHVDAEGRHPLHSLASSASGAATLQRLLASGENAQARDRLGQTPLHLATDSGYAGNLELLLEAGADPNALDKGQLPALARAVTQGRIDIVRVLLEHGADPNLATRGGDGLIIPVAPGDQPTPAGDPENPAAGRSGSAPEIAEQCSTAQDAISVRPGLRLSADNSLPHGNVRKRLR